MSEYAANGFVSGRILKQVSLYQLPKIAKIHINTLQRCSMKAGVPEVAEPGDLSEALAAPSKEANSASSSTSKSRLLSASPLSETLSCCKDAI